MYLPFVLDLAKRAKEIYCWYLIAALILVIRSVMTVAVVGEELSIMSRFPFYEAFRIMRVGDFERIELFFFALVFVCGLLALLFCYQGLVLGIQKLLQLENYRAIILPKLLLISLMLYMFPSDLEIMFFEGFFPSSCPYSFSFLFCSLSGARFTLSVRASPWLIVKGLYLP